MANPNILFGFLDKINHALLLVGYGMENDTP